MELNDVIDLAINSGFRGYKNGIRIQKQLTVSAGETQYFNENGDDRIYYGRIIYSIALNDGDTSYIEVYSAMDSSDVILDFESDVRSASFTGMNRINDEVNGVFFSKLKAFSQASSGELVGVIFDGWQLNK